jgi:mono/diheme cytochrome c family protein
LTAANASAVSWTAAEFKSYLATGVTTYHGVAAGPMGSVVHDGLAALPEADIDALSVYLADKVGATPDDPATSAAVLTSLKKSQPDPQYRRNLGERLYATACAACHYNAGQIVKARPELDINSAINLATPDNLIHVMLDGVNAAQGIAGVVMPGFRNARNDDQITAIAEYLREVRAGKPAWPDLAKTVADLRAKGSATH